MYAAILMVSVHGWYPWLVGCDMSIAFPAKILFLALYVALPSGIRPRNCLSRGGSDRKANGIWNPTCVTLGLGHLEMVAHID